MKILSLDGYREGRRASHGGHRRVLATRLPVCGGLLRGLDRRGVPHVRRNIWQDEAAAADVRAATGGSETVPTVKVGAQMLVNPSTSQVVSAIHRLDPHTDFPPVGPNRFRETLARLFGRRPA